MTLKHVLKHFSKKSENLGAKGSFAIAQDYEGFVIQRAKPEESHDKEVLHCAQDDGRFSREGCKELPSPVAFATQSPKCRKTRHFDKMLKQVQHDNFSCAKHTVKDLSSNRLNVLTTLKKAAFTLAEVFSSHCAGFRKAAFTLAEVLITLGIIGVVAAMTLPTLIQNHQKQTYVTGLKKAYANLQNAFAKMAYDEDVTEWSQTYCDSDITSEECFNRFKKQFNVVKEKYGATREECWGYYECSYIYTNDGMSYLFSCYAVYVDVNGDKGPNKWGRDRFNFVIEPTKNKIEPVGIDIGGYYQTSCTTANVNAGSDDASSCTAKVLIEGKMDY